MTTFTYEDLQEAIKMVRAAEAAQSKPLEDWLKEKMGDDFKDEFDTIMVHGDKESQKVGKYTIYHSLIIEPGSVLVMAKEAVGPFRNPMDSLFAGGA